MSGGRGTYVGRWEDMRQRMICGQSTLEYILIIAAILVAVIAAASTLIQPAVTQAMKDSSGVIEDASGKVAKGLGLP